MDFKKLFLNDKAVSPVIGVILMVAITVILAAAIGSSVFGQGTAESAPQANLDVQADGLNGNIGTIKIEHLGGDPINLANTATKIVAYVDGNTKTVTSTIDTLSVGDVKTFTVADVATGNTVNIKFIDIKTNQLICDKDVRF
jgi:flagellin-like protein